MGQITILIVPSIPRDEWMQEVLPDISAVELPLAGKRYIDYALEVANRHTSTLTWILDAHSTKRLEDEFKGREKDGFDVMYRKADGHTFRGLNDLEALSGTLGPEINDHLIVVWGIALTCREEKGFHREPVSAADCENTPMGIYRRKGTSWIRLVPDQVIIVQDVESWHKANFQVLHNPDLFTLPGYSAEKGVNLGRNVVLEHGTDVKGPVLLQDNAWCARNVVLDGDVIVGKDSFVSEGTFLKRTVIGSNTFLGNCLELVDKIVIGRRIIDAKSGCWTDLEEPWLARALASPWFSWLGVLFRALCGRSMGRRG
ncbi:MAG: hypothetical protein IJR99_00415 [Kiritimatiellae bacterium]|nr:hypothetical protein [Kiritimatiellia bacterium]